MEKTCILLASFNLEAAILRYKSDVGNRGRSNVQQVAWLLEKSLLRNIISCCKWVQKIQIIFYTRKFDTLK